MNKPLAALPLHSLKHLSPEHKVAFYEMAEIYLEATGAPEYKYGPTIERIRIVAQSIQEHTRLIPFKKIIPCWEPNWEDGSIRCSFPSYNGQVPTLDLRARLDDFLTRQGKKPKNWRMFAAKLDRESNIITFWAQDVAMKQREAAAKRKLLRGGKAKRGKKKIAKVKTRTENLQAARKLSTEELVELVQARGVSI